MAKPKTSRTGAPAPVITTAQAAAAFAKVQSQLGKLKEEELAPLTVDIQKVAGTVLGLVPRFREFQDEIAENLPTLSPTLADDIETRALGAWYAQMLFSAPRGEEVFKQMLEEATTLREALLVSAGPLVYKGLLEKEKIDGIRKGQGHIDKANDLVALGELYESIWPKIQGKTAVEATEWKRALELGPSLAAAVGARQQGNSAQKTDADLETQRVRAFTLLLKAYDELRRALTFLRWVEGDVDEIAPVLVKAPPKPREKKVDEKVADPAGVTPPPPAAGSGKAPAPAASPSGKV